MVLFQYAFNKMQTMRSSLFQCHWGPLGQVKIFQRLHFRVRPAKQGARPSLTGGACPLALSPQPTRGARRARARAFLRKGCLRAAENHRGRPRDEGRRQPHACTAALFPPPAVPRPWGQTGRGSFSPQSTRPVSSAGSGRDACPGSCAPRTYPNPPEQGQPTTACGPCSGPCLFL